MNFKNLVSKCLLSSTFSISLLSNNLYAGTHQAICAYYSGYSPCRVTISNTHLESNLPTDYLYVDKDNFLDLNNFKILFEIY